MGRRPGDEQSEKRVQRLVGLLLASVDDKNRTVADVATEAGLPHETVRRLRRNPGGKSRSGPGFFVVAALARAQGLSLDELAARTRQPK